MPSYSYLNETRWLPASASSNYAWDGIPASSRHQGLLRLQHDLSKNWQIDLTARARSRDLYQQLPGVLLLDAHLSWRPARSSEFSVAVANLADRRVLETYPEGAFVAIPTRRTFVIKWTQRFF